MLPEHTLIWIRPAIAFTLALAVMLVVRRFLLRRLATSMWKDGSGALVARAFRWPTLLWALAGSVAVALRFVKLSREDRALAHDLIGGFVIASLTLVAAGAAVRVLGLYGHRRQKPFVAAGLSKTLTYVLVWSLGGLWLLNFLDVDFKSITPFLTALGVGGLAVALALQDTLANFFAGVHILVEEPIALGEAIRLSTNEEGIVTDIGWRTTRVLTGQNNTVVIPNTKITSGILVNFSRPAERVVSSIAILVGHKADPDRVAAIALEETGRIPAILHDPAPGVAMDPGVLLTHVQLRLDFSLSKSTDGGVVQSQLRAALFRRFREEGIPLPEPPVKWGT